MKKLIFMLFFFMSGLIQAAEQSVTLSVPGMNCPTCPLTVRLSLEAVEGVKKAKVTYDNKQATIIFDDQITKVEELIEATTDAGYPSKLIN